VHCPTSTTTSTTTTCRDVASAPLMFSSQLDYLQVKIRCHVSGQASIVRRQVLEVGSDQIWITKCLNQLAIAMNHKDCHFKVLKF
jgi:hypothetical protein